MLHLHSNLHLVSLFSEPQMYLSRFDSATDKIKIISKASEQKFDLSQAVLVSKQCRSVQLVDLHQNLSIVCNDDTLTLISDSASDFK